MPFRIDTFDGEDLPAYLERGDTQSMGAAAAASDFVQLPGGGFYDNYGDRDGPRDLSQITKQTIIYASDAETVREQIEGWRAKVGKRAVLEALWHDGEVRWLYARLVKFTHTRPFNTRLTHLPCEFAFAPATGVWYGETQVDDSTTLAAGLGETVTVTHAGNANVTDPVIQFRANFTDTVTLSIVNEMTSQKLEILVGIEDDWTLIIDVGKRTVRLHHLPVAITTIGRSGTTITIDCGSAHGFSGGELVVVRGTSYDGFYEVATAPDSDTITVEADPLLKAPSGPESPMAGLLAEYDERFPDVTFSDGADWFWLLPGDNDITITSDTDLDGSIFEVIYWPTYA